MNVPIAISIQLIRYFGHYTFFDHFAVNHLWANRLAGIRRKTKLPYSITVFVFYLSYKYRHLGHVDGDNLHFMDISFFIQLIVACGNSNLLSVYCCANTWRAQLTIVCSCMWAMPFRCLAKMPLLKPINNFSLLQKFSFLDNELLVFLVHALIWKKGLIVNRGQYNLHF